MRRLLLMGLVLLALLAASLAGAGYWWVHQPLTQASEPLDLSVEFGQSPRTVAQAMADAGAQVNPSWLLWWFRLSGQSRQIKAGSYEIAAGTTPASLLAKLVRGEEALRSVTLVEGWTFAQVRAALQNAEQLSQDTRWLDNDSIMNLLQKPGLHPEGRFFPDTYTYAKGSSDLAVLKRALRAMERRLAAAWALRTPDLPVKTADDALILASIVEKETGKPADRSQIAGVFANRLRLGMLLQTDPSVIYGLGDKFDGNLRKRDLQTDTPYNSYTRAGLPPTPIAMPGKASLLAAVQPAPGKALYFVARGDGSSQFSNTLEEHNRAVNKYIRGR